MRITLGMVTERVKGNLMANADRLLDAQDRVSSGKQIQRPSDDVPGVGRALSYRSTIALYEQYKRNSNIGASNLALTSSTLDSVVNALQQVVDQALSAGKTMSPEARTSIANQLQHLSDQIAGIANTQHLGKYIFAGSLNNNKPMVENPTPPPPYTYMGNSEQFNIEIAPGLSIPTTVTGDKVFNMGDAAVSGCPDIFTAIETLKPYVIDGNVEEVSSHIEDVKTNLNNVIAIRSKVGARLKQLESVQESLLDARIRFMDLLSKTEDADLAESILELRTRENVYQAAVATANRVLTISLADFLT